MSKFDVSGFLAEFFDEAKSRLQAINQKLVLLETGELDDAGLIQLRRAVHTIKGSAQMLGVQDISELCHVFEDAIDFAIDYAAQNGNTQALPMIQFLFDLHDSLQVRLSEHDTEMRLDLALKQTTFEQLKKALNVHDRAEKETVVQEKPRKNLRRKKKMKVPKNLIAAVMGSFEGSLEKNKEAAQVGSVETDSEAQPQASKKIDFRPNISSLDIADANLKGGGRNFLRVDRTRLSSLSNQIVELSSVRFRDDAPEMQLQRIVQDFRALKDSMFTGKTTHFEESEVQSALDRHLRHIQQCSNALRYQQQRSSAMLDGVRDQVLGLLLKPLNNVFSVFPRTVRDIAKRSNKKVQLLIAGDAVEMDQLAAEALSEPLIHLINNAVAHGIETPEERVKCGKTKDGQITIRAKQKGNLIHLHVIDDGKGMDVEEIRNKAIEQGIVNQSEAKDMDTSEILELIFQPGFSTQEEVSELAGRGMGMSVVLDVMRELTGNIHIHSEKGKGTCFSMVFPVSLTVQQAKLFRISNQRFAMLANLVVQVMPLNEQQIKIGSGPFSKGYIKYEGHRVPVIDLRDGVGGQADHALGQAKMLVMEHLEGFLAMVVDEVWDKTEVMVREIDPYLKHYHPIGLMGCTIIDDGSVQLLIEPNGLKEMWRTAPDAALAKRQSDVQFNQRLLLVDDSCIALNIEKMMFEGMGFRVDTAMGGTDALEKLALNSYDLMITDLEMPDIDGMALIHRLRDEMKLDIPIVIIATRDLEDGRQRVLEAGANAYFAKYQLKNNEVELLNTLSGLLIKPSI